jgi:hypothetical protein
MTVAGVDDADQILTITPGRNRPVNVLTQNTAGSHLLCVASLQLTRNCEANSEARSAPQTLTMTITCRADQTIK